MYNSIENNKILRNAFNRGGTHSAHRNKTSMPQTEADTDKQEIPYVHAQEESVLLKCPCYPKRSADSAQSLPKFQ